MTSMDNGLPKSAKADITSRILGRTEFGLRILRLVGGLRLLVAAILLTLGFVDLTSSIISFRYPELYQLSTVIYLLISAGLTFVIFQMPDKAESAAIGQLIVDICAITIIVHASGGVRSGIEGLLTIFVATAGISLPRRSAYLGASVATIAILGEQTVSYVQGVTNIGDFVPVGLMGTIMLIIAFSIQPLLRRTEESEALALQRGIDLANLAQLNDYIIQNLRESILVVDAESRIRLINQSAAELLGTTRDNNVDVLQIVAPQLNNLLNNWRTQESTVLQAPQFVASDGITTVNTYIALLGPDKDGPVLMFLEDASILEDKVQQSKLAALGRLSASIAHEIRNPVGALSHAGQLLAESPSIGKEEQRFLDIIQKNSIRVNGIIENILKLSRKEAAYPQQISLNSWCNEFVNEFISTLELNESDLSLHIKTEEVLVRMDPSHLHQIAWNLCENAIKYARTATGDIAIEMHIGRRANNLRPFLNIVDHGEGVPERLQENLFEPFATGPDGGTGLGLYISRELCEQNRATLRYRPNLKGGSIFQIIFADPNRWESKT